MFIPHISKSNLIIYFYFYVNNEHFLKIKELPLETLFKFFFFNSYFVPLFAESVRHIQYIVHHGALRAQLKGTYMKDAGCVSWLHERPSKGFVLKVQNLPSQAHSRPADSQPSRRQTEAKTLFMKQPAPCGPPSQELISSWGKILLLLSITLCFTVKCGGGLHQLLRGVLVLLI